MAKPLQEELYREIEAVWGRPIPPREDPAYAEMVRTLREKRPDLLEMLYALEEVPREQEIQMRAREGSQRIQKALLMEEDENKRPFLSKEKAYNLLMVGAAVAVFAVVGTFLYGLFNRSGASSLPPPAVEAPPSAQEPSSPPSSPSPSPPPSPSPSPPPLPQLPPQGAAEEPPPDLPPPPSLDPAAFPELPSPSVQTLPPPQPLASLGTGSPPGSSGEAGVGFVSLPSGQASPQGAAQLQTAFSPGGSATFSTQAFQGLAHFQRGEAPQTPQVVREEAPREEKPQGGSTSPSSPPVLPPGLYRAQVVVEPVLVGGAPAPLVLEGSTPGGKALFLGSWELQAPGLVRGTVDRVLLGGVALSGRGQVYSSQNGTALLASAEDLAPALATDLVRAAVSGASRYVQDLREATRVVLGGGGLVAVERQAPPLLEQVVGSVASLFQPPQGGSLVRVYRIPRGTEVGVLWEP